MQLLMPFAVTLDCKISVRFGSWLTPLEPRVSAQALTFFQIVYAVFWKSPFQDFGDVWLLAHAFQYRSKRLGAYFFKVLMPYAGNLDFKISARFGPRLTPSGTGVSAYAFTFSKR